MYELNRAYMDMVIKTLKMEYKTIKQIIKECSESGIKRTEISELTGISTPLLHYYWKGKSKPSAENYFKIINAIKTLKNEK